MIGGLGIWEILLILIIVLVIFGANKLPEIGGGMGKAIRNFKKATNEPSEIDVTPKQKDESASQEGGEEKNENENESKSKSES